jgi:broad specificity phosphatase PhoE
MGVHVVRLRTVLCTSIAVVALLGGCAVPIVGEMPVTDHPEIPSGLKVSCMDGPDTLEASATCPTLVWGEHTYWAFGHRDNRTAMTVVAYDSSGAPVGEWYKPGARYLWQITRDLQAETVTLWGQGNRTIEINWAELRLPAGDATTIFVVRHAEKASAPPADPPLTEEGERRAETLARMLASSGVSAVYSTDYTRTRETVDNYADRHGIDIRLYEEVEEVSDRIRSQHAGQAILVAGHAPTVPLLLESLGIESPPPVGNEFDNLFVVSLFSDDRANLAHLKYEPLDLPLGGPDLVVGSFEATNPLVCDWVQQTATLPVRAVIENRGDEAAGDFHTGVWQSWNDEAVAVCFRDPQHSDPDPGGPDWCFPWVDGPVPPGGTVTLSGEVQAHFLTGDPFSLRARADSGECGTAPVESCLVEEVDEDNNESSPLFETCS